MSFDEELAIRMLYQARGFRATSVILHNKIHQDEEPLFFPAYASICTLTIELYLKALLYIETEEDPPRTHAVDKLFLKLPSHAQFCISEFYILSTPADRVPLETLLRESSLAFQKYRYFYEDSKPGGYYLSYELVDAIFAYLDLTVPELMEESGKRVIRLSDRPR